MLYSYLKTNKIFIFAGEGPSKEGRGETSGNKDPKTQAPSS